MSQLRRLGGRQWLPIGAAASAALYFATPAGAQTGQPTLSAEGQTYAAPERELEVNLSTDGIYDSNVLGARASAATLRGLQKDDFIIRPRLEGVVALPAGPVQFGLNASLGYDFYTHNTELDAERIDVTTTLAAGRANCGGIVTGGYYRGQSDLLDLSIEPGDPIASSVNIQKVSRINGTAYCGANVGLRAVGMVEYRTSRNSADLRKGSNVNNFTYGGGIMYSSPAVGQVTVFVGKSEFEYTDADSFLLVPFPDVNVRSAGVRWDRRLGARLQLNGQVTYVDVKLAGISGKVFNGVNWDIAASLRASDQLQISLATARQIDASAGFRSNYIKTTTYSATIDYALTDRLRLSLDGSHQKRNFALPSIPTTADFVENDKITRAQARLTFQRFRRLGFSVFGGYEKRNADVNIYDFDGFTAGAGITLKL